MTESMERLERWQQLVVQVREEYARLGDDEKCWIAATCKQISQLQAQLDQLFRQGDGLNQCRDCRGDCCLLGHNHLTLANLLLWFSRETIPPELDFSSTCPLLTEKGCVLSAEERPYSCISFLCDRIEEQLPLKDVATFYALERELRGLYRAFAERYAGGSMAGLLLTEQRLQKKPFLRRIDNL
jgi:hypothetical protein